MANGQGGARVGAGRKKKALADNITDGNPSKRKLTVLDFTDTAADLQGQPMPPPKAFLAAKQKNGKDLLAVQIYEETWQWLAERECARLVPAQVLEQYAMAISRWIQCEESITEYGFLAKHPTTGNAIPSPYVAMSQSFSKQANNLWYQIYQIVRENCSVEYKGATPHDDMIRRDSDHDVTAHAPDPYQKSPDAGIWFDRHFYDSSFFVDDIDVFKAKQGRF